METIYKEGMKVYDSFNFPDKEGIIETIRKESLSGEYIIAVSFMGMSDYQYYSLDGSIEISYRPTLSTNPYEVWFVGFQQRSPEDKEPINDLSKEENFIFGLIRRYNSMKEYSENGYK